MGGLTNISTMGKLTKNQKKANELVEANKEYSLEEASDLVKKITFSKFDASVDIDIRLGVDPRKADQVVRGVVALPNGIGKEVRVLVLCTPDKEEEAKAAGADHVGLDDYITKIEGGWTDIDVIITMPTVMANPKSGTVTMDIAQAVTDVKAGKIDFKVDKTGIILQASVKFLLILIRSRRTLWR